MSVVFSRSGFRTLAGAWALLGATVVVGVATVAASRWYMDRERRENSNYESRVREARSRLDAARHERDNLQQSADVYRTLVDRGLLQSERRLELIELIGEVRARHHIQSLDYEILPQRPLQLAGGRVFGSVDVLASRVKVRARALHEGDILGFIEALSQSRQGFYPIDRCQLRRIDEPDANSLQPRVEAECMLEWITLREKR